MGGIESLSNEELMQLSGGHAQQAPGIEFLSNEDLMAMAGQPQQPQGQQQTDPYSPYKDALSGELTKSLGQGKAFSAGSLKGLLGFGRGVGELETKLVDKLFGTKLAGTAPQTEIPSGMEESAEKYPASAQTGEFVGSSAPLLMLPEGATGELKALEPLIEKLPKALKGLTKFGGKAAKAAAVGAPLGAVYDPDAPVKESMESGALVAQLGPIAEGAIGLGKSAFNSLRKMGGMRTKKGAEEIMQAADELGLEIPAGEVIKSKPLQTLQETLNVIPGTGMPEAYNNLSDGLQEQIGGFLNKLNPENEHSGTAVQNHFLDKYNKAKDTANSLYDSLGSAIEEKAPGEIHDNAGLFDKAQSISDEFAKKKTQPGGETKVPADVSKLISQIKRKKYTLKDATEIDENINALIGDNIADVKKGGREGQTAKRAISHLKQLKEANSADIEKTIKDQDIPEITDAWSKAKEHYKTEIVPFIEKKSKLQEILQETNPDKIQSKFLSTSGVQPKSYELKKVTDNLPQDIKDKIAHQYLVGAKEEPEKMLQKFDKLQPKQKEQLFSEDGLKTLTNMSTLKRHFGREFNQMFSPKTGYQVLKYGVPATIYGAGTQIDPKEMGGVPTGLAALAAAGLGGKGIRKGLMSKGLKKQFLKSSKGGGSTDLGLLGLLGLPATRGNQE